MELVWHIAVMVCIYAILATSFNLLLGIAGLFAFGHAVFYALGAYATAILTLRLGLPFPLPLLAGMLITGAVGLAVALPSLRISGIYLVIITLALQVIAIDVIINWTPLTGGPTGLSGVPPINLFGWTLVGPRAFLPVAVVAACLCFLIARHIDDSPFGRAMRAMRADESAAADRRLLAERLARVLALFPILQERQRQIGGTLSGGQQQMLAIGMALMSGPRLLILDEPSIGLAPLLVERVMESVRDINRNYGATILLVEQNLKHGLAIASRAVVLNRGAKLFDGDPAALADEQLLLSLF